MNENKSVLTIYTTPPIAYTVRMKDTKTTMNPHQQICRACDQIITLSEPNPAIEYCLRCTEELNAWHDANATLNDDELAHRADLWESQENR